MDEVIEHEGHEIGAKRRVLRQFRAALVGRRVSIVACLFALFACLVEISRDLRPGGHHGAALLVGSELVNQYHRLRPAEKGEVRRLRRRRFTLMAIAVPAALFAAWELVNDLKVNGCWVGRIDCGVQGMHWLGLSCLAFARKCCRCCLH